MEIVTEYNQTHKNTNHCPCCLCRECFIDIFASQFISSALKKVFIVIEPTPLSLSDIEYDSYDDSDDDIDE